MQKNVYISSQCDFQTRELRAQPWVPPFPRMAVPVVGFPLNVKKIWP